jgi:hypothetical protein
MPCLHLESSRREYHPYRQTQQTHLLLLSSCAANHTCFNQSQPNWSKNKAPEHMFQRVIPSDLVPNITEWHKEV